MHKNCPYNRNDICYNPKIGNYQRCDDNIWYATIKSDYKSKNTISNCLFSKLKILKKIVSNGS